MKPLLVFLFTLLSAEHAQATKPVLEPEICELYLKSSIYKVNSAFQQSRKPTFNPEPESIEDKNPGLIAKLIKIRMGILEIETEFLPNVDSDLYSTPNFLQIPLKLQAFKKDLEELVQQHTHDPRIAMIMASLYPRIDLLLSQFDQNRKPFSSSVKANINRITSQFWESIVACLFAGEQLYLGNTISQFLPEEMAAFNFTRQQNEKFDREIDLAIKNKDGSWRWIEIKDWGEYSAQQSTNRRKLISQSHLQHRARQLFPNHKIHLELLMKYGVPQKDYEYFSTQTAFDQIYFVFPVGWDAN